MKITFYANPYGYDLTGFYFNSPGEYEEKLEAAQATDPSGDFEHGIELIDYDDPTVEELVKYLGGKVSPTEIDEFYDVLENADYEFGQHLAFINSVGGYSGFEGLDDALRYAEEGFEGAESSMVDYARRAVEEELISNLDYYFDYEAFGRDLQYDFDEEDEERYDGMSDYDIGAEYVDNFGSLNDLGPRTLMRYVDYDKLARDLEIEGFQEVDFDGSTYIYRYH